MEALDLVIKTLSGNVLINLVTEFTANLENLLLKAAGKDDLTPELQFSLIIMGMILITLFL